MTAALSVEEVSKRYRHVTALDSVSLDVGRGEVVGLVGENGAGKSTLLNGIVGNVVFDSGQVFVHGDRAEFDGPREAARRGISIVRQEKDILTNLTGAENLFLGREEQFSNFGLIRREEMMDTAKAVIAELNMDIDMTARASRYSFNEMQMLEIAKAFSWARQGDNDHPVVLLDEPTSGLEESGRELLFDLIEELRDRAAFVFVSHELDEVIAICDRIYVMKDGRINEETDATSATEEQLKRSMVGREASADYYRVGAQLREQELGEPVLEVCNLAREGEIDPVSFTLRRGEILGIAGVDGSGKQRLGRLLVGDIAPTGGYIKLNGCEISPDSVAEMTQAGVGYLPKDRKSEGLLLYQPVYFNTSIALISELVDLLPLTRKKDELDRANEMIEDLEIKTPSAQTAVQKLSGGNQQKVVFGRWLNKESPILVMDNPTRGIDVGAKEEIYDQCRELSEQGVSMIYIGDELPELIGLSNRIGVMKNGELTDILPAPREDKPDEEQIIDLMI